MYRSILTGFFVVFLSVAGRGIAGADETAAVTVPAPISAAPVALSEPLTTPASSSAASAAAAAGQASAVGAETDEVAAPTSGADLAMWNASPVPVPEMTRPAKPLARLRRFASGIVSRSSAIASSLTRSAMRFIGVPYVFGGTRTTGFDCSGYVQHVFSMHGVHLPRTADAQFVAARHIRTKMAPGDLVFFHTYAPGVSHVGIYLGQSKFIHASSSRGVAVSSLHDRYWAPRYLGAKRVVGS